LTVFDSFEGLPSAEDRYLKDKHCRRSDDWVTDWSSGRYAARLDEVKANVERYGNLSVCKFVKGWFADTLLPHNLTTPIAFAFADVDLANSARDCFTAIWPILSNAGVYVTHDTSYIKVLQELYNPNLWREQFKGIPPILFGAGYGLCNDSPHIGYMVKGESLSPDYLKSLTIDK
jgi:O-methyltransferase